MENASHTAGVMCKYRAPVTCALSDQSDRVEGESMELTRRQFAALASSAAGAAALGMAGCSPSKDSAKPEEAEDRKQYVSPMTDGEITRVRTACGNCHNNCGMIANVRDGVIISLEGDPEHPHGKGSLCPKA